MKKLFFTILVSLLFVSCTNRNANNDSQADPNDYINNMSDGFEIEKEEVYNIHAEDSGVVVYSTANRGAYRYGPSILLNEDGSYDAWFSAPGNNSSQWDWINYMYSSDGTNWKGDYTVLKPTAYSKDRCSVCDPGVIYFNGYYYLGYTSTNDANGGGANNSAFVARSESPDGPFEKWNGEGWGGDPEPIIAYEDDPSGWGIGEISFVIKDEDLFIYYTYFDLNGGSTRLMKADLVDDWPNTMRDKGTVLNRAHQDSLDVAYDDNLEVFIGLSIDYRMSSSSRLAMYVSEDGKDFIEVDHTDTEIREYSHNVGIAKDFNGHIDTNNKILIGYAYGANWGRWSAVMQYVKIARFYV